MFSKDDFKLSLAVSAVAQAAALVGLLYLVGWNFGALLWYLKWRMYSAPLCVLLFLVAAVRFSNYGLAAIYLDAAGMVAVLARGMVHAKLGPGSGLGMLPLFLEGIAAVCYVGSFVFLFSLLYTRIHDVPIVLIRAPYLYITLRHRGYYWMTFLKARTLWEIAGASALRLPPWEMVGTLPGVEEGDVRQLGILSSYLQPRSFFDR